MIIRFKVSARASLTSKHSYLLFYRVSTEFENLYLRLDFDPVLREIGVLQGIARACVCTGANKARSRPAGLLAKIERRVSFLSTTQSIGLPNSLAHFTQASFPGETDFSFFVAWLCSLGWSGGVATVWWGAKGDTRYMRRVRVLVCLQSFYVSVWIASMSVILFSSQVNGIMLNTSLVGTIATSLSAFLSMVVCSRRWCVERLLHNCSGPGVRALIHRTILSHP